MSIYREDTPEQEEQLSGGNTADSVVRLASTVRKPMTPSTPAVHRFLAHLRATGFESCPGVLGIDEKGRQVLEFVPGPLWADNAPHTQIDFRRVGFTIRALHEASISFQQPEEAQWYFRYERDEHELICHNDLAPWNLVCGPERWVFIDWDAAAPSTRLWDLAWACISFPPFKPESSLSEATTAMHALLDGYGLEEASFAKLIRLMISRARAEFNFIVEGARKNEQPWARLYAEEHHQYWGPVSDFIERHALALEQQLTSLGQRDS